MLYIIFSILYVSCTYLFFIDPKLFIDESSKNDVEMDLSSVPVHNNVNDPNLISPPIGTIPRRMTAPSVYRYSIDARPSPYSRSTNSQSIWMDEQTLQ